MDLTNICNPEPKMSQVEDETVDVEMPQRTFSAPKLDMAKLSARAAVVNSSILDNVVSKFSIVSDHHVRGRWRPALAISIIVIPILAFCLMLWYQIRIACIANCQYYPLIEQSGDDEGGTAYSTESTIRNFLGQESIHFCSSTVSQLLYDAESNSMYTSWYPCTIRGHDYSSTGTCSSYNSLGKISSANDGGNCFDPSTSGSVAIFYTQCVPIQTALVNSVQVSLYSAIGTIVIYLILRVLAKHGVVGLFQPAKWTETLNNKAKVKNDEWLRLDSEKE